MNPERQEPITLAQPVALLRHVNHDLRNPLNALMATANMLTDGIYDPLTTKQIRAVQRIERNAGRMLALLDDLIGYVKAEAGEYPLVIAAVDPRKLLDQVVATCAPVAKAKNLSFSASSDDTVPAIIQGDQAVVQRIILAVVWNAISFTPEGSVEIKSTWENGWLVTVKDTGPGIPASAVPHLFEAFWRGDVVGSPVPTGGCGLGLTMAHAFAQLMHAELCVKESSSQGGVFTFFLPA